MVWREEVVSRLRLAKFRLSFQPGRPDWQKSRLILTFGQSSNTFGQLSFVSGQPEQTFGQQPDTPGQSPQAFGQLSPDLWTVFLVKNGCPTPPDSCPKPTGNRPKAPGNYPTTRNDCPKPPGNCLLGKISRLVS